MAGGDILGSTANATDINTSSSNGTITLSADSLGASGQPLQLNPGTGLLNLTATTGGAFVQLQAGDLLFSRLSLHVPTANQQIVLSTLNGHITLDSLAGLVSTGDDDWTLITGGANRDITFSTARRCRATRSRSRPHETSAPAPIAFLMQPSGSISATAGGNIFLAKATGDLDTGDFTALDAGGGIASIAAAAGSVNVDNVTGLQVANDTLRINASGDIAFGTTLTANRVELDAGGNITSASGTGVDISAAAGIDLEARGVGASGERLVVNPGSSAISVETTGSGAAGSIYLESSAALDLAAFTTAAGSAQTIDLRTTAGDVTISTAITSDDHWILTASGDIIFQATLAAASVGLTAGDDIITPTGSGVDISAAGGITLTGRRRNGASGERLIVNPGSGVLSATTSGLGDRKYSIWNPHHRPGFGRVSRTPFTQTIDLRTSGGDLTISTAIDTDDEWFLDATGNITFGPNGSLKVNLASLTAGGAINGSGTTTGIDIDTSDNDGAITLIWRKRRRGHAAGPRSCAGQITVTATAGGVGLVLAAGDLLTSADAGCRGNQSANPPGDPRRTCRVRRRPGDEHQR